MTRVYNSGQTTIDGEPPKLVRELPRRPGSWSRVRMAKVKCHDCLDVLAASYKPGAPLAAPASYASASVTLNDGSARFVCYHHAVARRCPLDLQEPAQ